MGGAIMLKPGLNRENFILLEEIMLLVSALSPAAATGTPTTALLLLLKAVCPI